MAKALPKPFRYRGGWRAQAACKNGTRPHDDFAGYELAKAWMVEALANINRAHEPELGSPSWVARPRLTRSRTSLLPALDHQPDTRPGRLAGC